MKDVDVKEIKEQAIYQVMDKGPDLLLALITLLVGWWVIGLIRGVIMKAMNKGDVEPSLSSFLSSILGITFKILLIISVAGMIGIETTSFLTMLGAAGLAIGLALQGSLANFAGGVLILIFKPFRVGDVVEAADKVGTVERIDILYTTLNTFDNKTIVIPNGDLANSVTTNFTAKPERRIEFKVGISYDDNVQKAREIILGILEKDARVLRDPAPVVVLTDLGDSSLNLSVRAWAKLADFWPVYWENLELMKEELDKNDITIPFPQRDVHLYQHIAENTSK